ncbi:MAG: efflux RND transporter periplasmic adaptor subunit [Sandaracinus sp.]|nr:efflux RND transporter periplasmic adaptor subunit [Sandaracinus sp.]
MRAFLQRHGAKLVPLFVVLVLLVVGLVFRTELVAWFSGEPLPSEPTYDTTVSAGPFSLGLELQPDPPRQNGNVLHLRVTDADGDAVEGADLGVRYVMPAMGSMQEMRGEADVEDEGDGRYTAEFDLPMAGSWTLEIELAHDGASAATTVGLTVGTSGLTTQGGSGADAVEAAPPTPPHAFSEASLSELREGLRAYEQIRAMLAADTATGTRNASSRIATALDAAAAEADLPSPLNEALSAGARAARDLPDAADVEPARACFGEVSRAFVAASEADPRLREGLHVFRCPMAQGFQKWIQPSATLENPYMGTRMLQCGSGTDWAVAIQTSAPADPDDIAFYTCGMHPSVRQDGPGTCPICAMDLTPVTTEEVETGVILVDAARRQRIGLRTATLERRALSRRFRAIGRVVYDETRLTDVSLRMSGWVQRLAVDEPGQHVRRGQVLFTLYSPELYAAQLEYLSALRSRSFADTEGGDNPLARAARQRLILLGMSGAQVNRVRARGEAMENVPVLAPATGYVIEKEIVEGAHIEAGTRVYRIANLDDVWVEADVYEGDLTSVRLEQEVTVTLPNLRERTFEGRVSFIYPYLDDERRTARVRVALDNPDLALRPAMYADVDFDVELGEGLAVPVEAVIYTGPRRVVFVDLGEGRLRPEVVELGPRAGDYYVVRSGLDPGDTVVTSGTFLVASESRLRSSLDAWAPSADDDGAETHDQGGSDEAE